MSAESLIESVRTWATPRDDIHAVALVGSYARGEARPDSDIDLVLVCADPARYLKDTDWPATFGEVTSISFEDWGLVQSMRVAYRDGREVEFGITSTTWLTIPADAGTAAVLRGGSAVLLDRNGRLERLLRSVREPGHGGTPIDRSWYAMPPEPFPRRLSAGGVVTRRERGRVLIALAREGDHAAPVLPKGGVEPGESIESAARREIHEELGIAQLELLAPLGTTERLVFDKTAWVTTHFFLYRTTEVAGTPADTAHHHHGPTWRALTELDDLFWPDQRELLERHRELIEDSA
jgi:ADP-ribose pyrophosphatase YjhB (NUDIX family)